MKMYEWQYVVGHSKTPNRACAYCEQLIKDDEETGYLPEQKRYFHSECLSQKVREDFDRRHPELAKS